MSFLVKTNYSPNLTSTAMAMCSSFCPQIPNQFRRRPICSFPARPLFSVSFKALSSQANNASTKGNFVIFLVYFVILQTMSPIHVPKFVHSFLVGFRNRTLPFPKYEVFSCGLLIYVICSYTKISCLAKN